MFRNTCNCVKLALSLILERKPDLCVSGINHGANSSINVIYSGTMSAALEGAIGGVLLGFLVRLFLMLTLVQLNSVKHIIIQLYTYQR